MILSGIRCDKCNRTELIKYENEETIKILFRTKGWKTEDAIILCPLCKMKETAN